MVNGLTRTIPTFIVGQFLIFLCKLGGIENRAISRNCSRAALRSSTISLGEDIGIGEIVGLFQALVPEPENFEAVLIAAL